MIISDKKFEDGKLMLHLFEEHVKRQLREILQPHIEGALNEAIEQAMKSMQPSIEIMYHAQNSERLVRIILDDKRKS